MSPILESIGSVKGFGWGKILSSTAFESIATATVGSGGTSYVDFTSIPQTFTNLQIRGIIRGTRSGKTDDLKITFNNDTNNNYNKMTFGTLGSTRYSYHQGDLPFIPSYEGYMANTTTAGFFSALIFDILDYRDSSKYKSGKFALGCDSNGDTKNILEFSGGTWRSLDSITSIKIEPRYGSGIAEFSNFALYGIRGA